VKRPSLPALREALQQWMLRGRHSEALPIEVPQRRVYIVPTREGLGFAALLLAMLIASLNYNLALGFLLSFSLAGIAQVCLLRTHRNLNGLVLASARGANAHEGGILGFELVFADRSQRAREALELIAADGYRQSFSLAANGFAPLKLALTARRRGRQRLGRIRIETRFPLGLFRAWTLLEPDVCAWVYPSPEAKAPPPPLHGSGAHASRTPAPGTDSFDSLRPYQPGDPLRAIAWKRLARGEAPASKLFSSEESGEQRLAWQDCQALPGIEARLSRLCAWALEAERSGRNWSLTLPGARLAMSRGPSHLSAALEALASFPSSDER
jgi:uncharacterized protein (DUF58 family)